MEDALAVLRTAIAANSKLELVSSAQSEPVELGDAKMLRIELAGRDEPLVLGLDTQTRFQSEDPETRFIDLKTVYVTWIYRDLSVTDYIANAEEAGVTNLKFLERKDLLDWLKGESDESEYIVGDATTATGSTSADGAAEASAGTTEVVLGPVEKKPVSAELQKILSHERALTDHNLALRGTKLIDFSSVSKDSHRLIMQEYKNKISWSGNPAKRAKTATPATSSNGNSGLVQTGKNKEPIILLSSSPSSLLNMANVKDFLESGIFEPVLRSSSVSNLHRISRDSKLLGKTRFIVVDSVEKFKPEYWDRVVGVFVTGQSWQLKPYKWSDPHSLFQHVLGFSLTYKGDPIPPLIQQWNVQVELLDRTHRFRDKEVVERIWERLEANMVSRGWPTKKN